jgi:predicted RND superfamily exporter protein
MKNIYRRPVIILFIIAAVTIFFALQLSRLELDNNNFRFISADDPARLVLKEMDDEFGSSVFVLVGLKRKYGTVFDAAFLNKLRDYVERVEAIDIVDPVQSIVNADYITGSGDAIVVEKLLPDEFAGTEEEVAALKERLLSWDLYRRALISDDFAATQILVPLSIPAEDSGKPEVVDSYLKVRDIAREMFAASEEVYVTGIPVISATINEAMRADLALLVPLVVLVVLLTLFFSFRNIGAVVLPLLTVLVAAIWSVGARPLFDIKLSVVSTVLPVILVAVGSAYGIHVVTHYLEERGAKGKTLNREEHFNLIMDVLEKIRKPVFLAALTTFAGFISFAFTLVLPIREFGFFASFGVLVSFGIALTMIPSLLILRGPGRVSHKGTTVALAPEDTKVIGDSIVSRFFTSIALHKGTVLFFACIVIAVSIFGATKLIIDNVFIEYFKDDTDIARSDKFIREQFGGSKTVSVVARAESSAALLAPESLAAIDGLAAYLEANVPEAGKAMGFTDLVKRINQVFNVDEPAEGISSSNYANEEIDDFGFGGFGFGDYEEEISHEPHERNEPHEQEEEKVGDKTYTVAELTALFNKAASSGADRTIDAGEFVRQLKRLVNYEGYAYYEIPANPAKYGKTDGAELANLVANYLILLSGDIGSYANDPLEPTAVKTNIQLRTLGEADTARAVKAIEAYIAANFPPEVKATIAGTAMVEASLNRNVVNSQIISVFISLALVFLIIAFSNKSLVAGVVGIVPLSLAILINFAVMGFLGIKLNIGTSMIASLAVGIGIDYTIHYIEAFKREIACLNRQAESGLSAQAGVKDLAALAQEKAALRAFLGRTFAVSGKAIIINAVSVGLGFAVLLFSKFNMLGDFGLLIALTMGTSALVSLTVVPALLLAIKPRFVYAK